MTEIANVTELLTGAADRAGPGRPALEWGGQAIGWEQLLAATASYAGALSELEVERGTRVLVQAQTAPPLLYTLFGIWRLGATAVLSNTANTSRELGELAAISGARVAILDAGSGELAGAGPLGSVATVLGLGSGGPDRDLSALAAGAAPAPAVALGPDAEATLLFTSGSTAAPKCVPFRHGHHIFSGEVVAGMLGLGGEDTFLHYFPLFHMNGLGHVFGAVTAGTTLLMKPRFRTGEFRAWVRDEGPTATSINATHVKMLRNDSERLAPGESRLRVAQLGLSALLPEELYEEFEAEFGCQLVESYGLTETATLCSVGPLEGSRRMSCGKPVDGYEVVIRDGGGSELGAGVAGNIWIHARNPYALADGYLGADGPARPEAIDSGDVGEIDGDGFLHWLDRRKEIIKRAGENIQPSEVELVLEGHPLVEEAVVVGVPDALREEVPWAWVLPGAEAPTEDDLLGYCREHLAKFKVPQGIDVVDEFPRTGVGKVQRTEVRHWVPARRRIDVDATVAQPENT